MSLKIEYIILGIVIFNSTIFLWFLKTVAASGWLYLKERHYLDLVMACLFAAFSLERVFTIIASYAIYTVNTPDTVIPASAYYSLLWRMLTLILVNLACWIYDVIFYRYKPENA